MPYGYGDYDPTPQRGAISMTKLKNELKRRDSSLVPHLSNVRINRSLHGCSGFLEDPATGRIVYVSTDVNHGTTSQALYRTAKHLKDFTGGRNRRTELDPVVIIDDVEELIADDRQWATP